MTKAAANKDELLSIIQHGANSGSEAEREYIINLDRECLVNLGPLAT